MFGEEHLQVATSVLISSLELIRKRLHDLAVSHDRPQIASFGLHVVCLSFIIKISIIFKFLDENCDFQNIKFEKENRRLFAETFFTDEHYPSGLNQKELENI